MTAFGVDGLMPLYTEECVRFVMTHARKNVTASGTGTTISSSGNTFSDRNTSTGAAVPQFLLVFAPDNTHVPIYASSQFKVPVNLLS